MTNERINAPMTKQRDGVRSEVSDRTRAPATLRSAKAKLQIPLARIDAGPYEDRFGHGELSSSPGRR